MGERDGERRRTRECFLEALLLWGSPKAVIVLGVVHEEPLSSQAMCSEGVHGMVELSPELHQHAAIRAQICDTVGYGTLSDWNFVLVRLQVCVAFRRSF